jgi:4-amino-4-deoxy-L-arabinose transferase-like glycosyltransferase
VIFALIAAWLMTRIARRISASPALLIVPPVLFLVHPGVLLAESRGGVEILFTMMVVLFILAVYRAIESSREFDYVICGLVLGLTVLIRSTPLLFPGFLFLYLIATHGRTSKAIAFRNIGYIVLTVSAILSPWIVRNYLLTRKFVPTASVLGVSAQTGQYICTHMTRDTQWVNLDRQAAKERERIAEENGYKLLPGYYQTFFSAEDELRFSKDLTKRVLAVYAQAPLLCVKCMAYNVFNFWCAGKTWRSTFMSLLVQFPYLVLALAGIIACTKGKRFHSIAPMVLFMFYTMCVYIPILAQARYSVPLVPFVAILAAVALVAFRQRLVAGRGSEVATDQQEPQREHSMVLASASGKL